MSEKRRPRRKADTLQAWYGKIDRYDNPDLCVQWEPSAMSGDGNLVLQHLSPLIEELKKRGYDLSTFKMTIKRSATPSLTSPAETK